LETARHRPDFVRLTESLSSDERVPRLRRWALRFTAYYVKSPIDLIPDIIPVLGVVDDMLLVNLTVKGAAKSVDQGVIKEHWDGSTDPMAVLDRTHQGIMALLNRE
jgi:uncharacterized membrane protein YkvA (DUF1232 family)